MNARKAKRIRKRYADGASVQDIKAEEGVSAGVIYSVIRNQTWHDPSYTPPKRPRDVLEDVGLIAISGMRSDGRSWHRISDAIRENTGVFVRGDSIREWYTNQDDVARTARRYARRQGR